MPNIKGRLKYKGYISPAPRVGASISEKRLLAKVYGTCRTKNSGEIKANKTKCSKIAWSVVNREY